jgi:hypothetical protein
VAVPDVEIDDGEIAQSLEAKADGTVQDKATVPVNECKAVTVSVAVVEELRLTVTEAGLTESWKSGESESVFCQSAARLNALIEPRPVTWSYPVPAE